MLHVILTILKILGLIILVVLGLIILLTILILAAPISYEAKAGYDQDVSVFARVRLLYRIVGVRFRLEEKKTKLEILLFGFVLGGKKKKKEEEIPEATDEDFLFEDMDDPLDDDSNQTEDNAKEEENHTASEPESVSESISPEEIKEEEPVDVASEEEEAPYEEEETEEISQPQTSVTAESEDDEEDDESYEFSDELAPSSEDEGKKKAGAMDYVRRIWDFLNRDSVQKLIGKLMRSIGKIIKHILPRSLDLSGEVGFEDPQTTGKVMEICAILYGLYGDHIRITSDFEEPKLKGEASLKGRIVPGYIVLKVLGMGIRVILNKECRKLFHDIRHGL